MTELQDWTIKCITAMALDMTAAGHHKASTLATQAANAETIADAETLLCRALAEIPYPPPQSRKAMSGWETCILNRRDCRINPDGTVTVDTEGEWALSAAPFPQQDPTATQETK